MIDRFESQDLNLCAFLRLRGLHHLEVFMTPRGRFVLVFDRTDTLKALCEEFFADSPVPAKSFIRAQQELKQAVFGAARLQGLVR